MKWILWAHSRNNKFWHIGSKRYVEIHGLKDPIVEVEVTENPDGEYYGCIKTGEDTPIFIWPSKSLLSICFPYGLDVMEQSGQGRVVRLNVSEYKR